ncbi:glycosyltransferase family 4 protein [Bradyrhizobium sp. McL0616]|uniref:glycosyltransferase family 4 protein n=1 Tax=Bradyrhizobium sp. McL0616 TaxID=3415674 RepID=UPI003CF9AE82
MRILIALPGLHRYDRGAEFAFIAVAKELAKVGDKVTLIGSGNAHQQAMPYRFLRAASVRRENFESYPSLPGLRNEYCYEELTFVPQLLYRYRPDEYDITVTCSYPFTNWALRRPVLGGRRPRHVFVTHNGDWPAYARQSGARQSEFRFFDCDGLICINPDFHERNVRRWNSRLIPNGVDCDRFRPGLAQREQFGLPQDKMIVLMVSALIPNKRIEFGIDAVSRITDAHLVVAGDGPLRKTIAAEAARRLPGRFTLLSVAPERMPSLYQAADVFLQCSKDEPFPLVFLEAMACGLPIVGHDIPRVRWFVGDDEFLANMDDPAAIAESIQRARSLGSAGRDKRLNRAASFSWTKIAGMYRDFFQDIITGSDTETGFAKTDTQRARSI